MSNLHSRDKEHQTKQKELNIIYFIMINFPRLPLILLCDSLYAGEPVFDICKRSNWNYIIRYKEGGIPGIMKGIALTKNYYN